MDTITMERNDDKNGSNGKNGSNDPKTTEENESKEIIEVQLGALDDLVNVNSLFTIAIFVGLLLAAPNQHSLDGRPECDADAAAGQRLVKYEVVSFACFLLSSLAAKTCKVILNTKLKLKKDFQFFPRSEGLVLTVAGLASVCGVLFLTLSMVEVVQIKIGKLSCGIPYAKDSVVSLCVIVGSAMVIYLPHMLLAIGFAIFRDAFVNFLKTLLKAILYPIICCYVCIACCCLPGKEEPPKNANSGSDQPLVSPHQEA